MNVLIVDDDNFTLKVLSEIIANMGRTAIIARSGQEALERLHHDDIHLVITDWDMPGMDGLELCRSIRREDFPGYIYVIMLTAREGRQSQLQGIEAGADDFLFKPVHADDLLARFKTADRILSLETRDVALFAMAKLAESRDPETGAHIERVQNYARIVARHLPETVKKHYGVDEQYIQLLFQTSPLHDIGKVAIPDSVLLKPGKLSPAEYEVMKSHTTQGAQTLDAALQRFSQATYLQMARDIAATHHEKFDGSGYPRGLSGQDIPLCGRIVAIADVYDALTSRRVYKDAMSHQQSKSIILRESGRHFDPDIVAAFNRAEQQIVEIYERFRDEPQPAAKPLVQFGMVEEAPTIGAGSKILVVDDSPITRNLLVQVLSQTGATILAAPDATEALKLMNEHAPQAIISDLEMPGQDGLQFCRQVRHHPTLSGTYFIMLTTHSSQSALLESYNAGVNDFVCKPFNPKELLARIRVGIQTVRLKDDLEQKTRDLRAMNTHLAAMNSKLDRLSVTDELTGLFNRRYAMRRLEEQAELAERYGHPLTVAILDIDHFKQVNDTYGHDVGDEVLRNVAGVLREQVRGTDVVCRVGGEEFLILFPAQTVDEAEICVERCRAAVELFSHHVHDFKLAVTISGGLAMRDQNTTQLQEVLKSADDSLYAAKAAGRNCIRKPARHKKGPSIMNTRINEKPVPVQSRQLINENAVRERCGGDAEFAAAVIDRFSQEAPGEVRRIVDAGKARDVELLRRTAHNLKSMAGYVSADDVAEISRKIEACARDNDLAQVEPFINSLEREVEQVVRWIQQNTVAQPSAA